MDSPLYALNSLLKFSVLNCDVINDAIDDVSEFSVERHKKIAYLSNCKARFWVKIFLIFSAFLRIQKSNVFMQNKWTLVKDRVLIKSQDCWSGAVPPKQNDWIENLDVDCMAD